MTHTDRVLLVSHGQPSAPATGEAEIIALAEAVAFCNPGIPVRGATLAAPGALEAVLDGARAPLIYPFFMADGWFTQSALPKRLAGAGARQMPPFGLDPGLPGFTDRWLSETLAQQGWSAVETTLFVAGHGSGRSPRPAEATRAFAAALSLEFAEVRCGFVEESPHLAEAAQELPDRSICLPFFALKRGHVLEDLPRALEATGFSGVLLDPFGLHPALPEFLASRIAAEAGGQKRVMTVAPGLSKRSMDVKASTD